MKKISENHSNVTVQDIFPIFERFAKWKPNSDEFYSAVTLRIARSTLCMNYRTQVHSWRTTVDGGGGDGGNRTYDEEHRTESQRRYSFGKQHPWTEHNDAYHSETCPHTRARILHIYINQTRIEWNALLRSRRVSWSVWLLWHINSRRPSVCHCRCLLYSHFSLSSTATTACVNDITPLSCALSVSLFSSRSGTPFIAFRLPDRAV